MNVRTPCLGVLLASTAAVAAPLARLELVAEARVSDREIVLGDVVRLHSEDLGLARRLANLPVGPAPQPGQSALVQKEALAEWVRRTTGLPFDTVQWSGAEVTRVHRSARLLRGDEIADAAIAVVRAGMAASGQHGELRVRGSLRDVEVPAGPVRLLPRPMEPGVALRSRLLVWVDVWVADRFVRSFPVSVEGAGLSVHSAEVRLPATGTAIQGTEAAGSEMAGVSRGEWAALRTSAGAVSLESRVEVLQDGRVGQRVRVRSSVNASGVLFAKVVGRGQLELTP
jgi:flagellar basal body P-ring formation protein FlgA